jgi:hypothetical protein
MTVSHGSGLHVALCFTSDRRITRRHHQSKPRRTYRKFGRAPRLSLRLRSKLGSSLPDLLLASFRMASSVVVLGAFGVRARQLVRENDWFLGYFDGVQLGLVTGMTQIDRYADTVHPIDDFSAILTHSAVKWLETPRPRHDF